MFKLCVLTRWDFNFCVRSSPLRGMTQSNKGHCMETKRDWSRHFEWEKKLQQKSPSVEREWEQSHSLKRQMPLSTTTHKARKVAACRGTKWHRSNCKTYLPGQFTRIRLKIKQNCRLFLDIFVSAIMNDLFMTFTSRLKVNAKCVYQQWNWITEANYFGTPPADWVHGYLYFEPGAWIWTNGFRRYLHFVKNWSGKKNL